MLAHGVSLLPQVVPSSFVRVLRRCCGFEQDVEDFNGFFRGDNDTPISVSGAASVVLDRLGQVHRGRVDQAQVGDGLGKGRPLFDLLEKLADKLPLADGPKHVVEAEQGQFVEDDAQGDVGTGEAEGSEQPVLALVVGVEGHDVRQFVVNDVQRPLNLLQQFGKWQQVTEGVQPFLVTLRLKKKGFQKSKTNTQAFFSTTLQKTQGFSEKLRFWV